MSDQLYDPDQKQRLDDLLWSEKVADAARNSMPMPVRHPPPATSVEPVERPPQPVVVPPPSDPEEAEAEARAALIAAVEHLRECETEAARSVHHVARQRERISDLQAALAPFENLDARMIATQLARLKADQSDELPDDLSAQRTERGKLIDRTDLAAKSLDVLLLEAELAGTRAQAAFATASMAATKLIVTWLMHRVVAIKELETEAAALRAELQSFAEVWLPIGDNGVPRPMSMPPAMVNLLRSPPANANVISTAHQRQRFVALHAALINDPATELPPL